MHRVGGDEIRALERLPDKLDVLREPEVVVAQVADNVAAGLTERLVPVRLAVARALGMVEEPNALVSA